MFLENSQGQNLHCRHRPWCPLSTLIAEVERKPAKAQKPAKNSVYNIADMNENRVPVSREHHQLPASIPRRRSSSRSLVTGIGALGG
jgi:hypothetical protein